MKKVFFPVIALIMVCCLALPLAAPVSAETTWELWGGNYKNHNQVGTVHVWDDGVNLYVKYELFVGWQMTETHVAVAHDFLGIPQTKNGNPKPGKFPYGTEYPTPVTEDTYTIPLVLNDPSVPPPPYTLYVATHAVVQLVDEGGEIIQEETAWGDCHDFPGKSWAKWFPYDVE